MNGKYIIPLVVIPVMAVTAAAQSIDPTVEVSRTYQGKMIEVHKPMIGMQIPDSVTRFDLDFDYSVFDSPYKGTYEFNPYIQDMKPQPDAWSGRRFFLRAGAGYPLHPVFDLVWSPDLKGKFRMSVYAMHRSYIGRYRSIVPVMDASSGKVFLDSRTGDSGERVWNGRDMLTKAGVDGRLDWTKGIFSFDVGYYGISTADTLSTRGYNALDASLRVASKDRPGRHFVYDLALAYRFGTDNVSYSDLLGQRNLSGHDLTLDASLGAALSNGGKVLVDVDAETVSYTGVFGTVAGRVALTPRYILDKGRWNLDLGVMLSALISGAQDGPIPAQDTEKGQYVYPDITIGFEIVKDYLDIYAQAGGGEHIGRYSDIIGRHHFIHPLYTSMTGTALLDNSVERISASLGLRGNISSRFSYDLKAGYRNFANAPLFSAVSGPGGVSGNFYASLGYTGYQAFYASLDCGWESEDFMMDGRFVYCSTDLWTGAVPSGTGAAFFAPAAFSGDVRAMYNWRKRIFIGADCDFSLPRESSLCSIGGYADLGLYLEFRAARLFSFWLRGGNLLDMTIQRTPLYAESGINFTAGICLNL